MEGISIPRSRLPQLVIQMQIELVKVQITLEAQLD